MIKTKVYNTYYPYLANTNAPCGNGYGTNIEDKGKGIEYCFDEEEEKVIDYDNYYHSSFDLFWDELLARFDWYQSSSLAIKLNNEPIQCPITKEQLQTILKTEYLNQKKNKNTNPYYCYVKMNDNNFYSKFSSDSNIINLIQFLFNRDYYISSTGNISSSSSLQESLVEEDRKVDYYMGVDVIDDLNQGTITKFHYYEFQTKTQRVQHKIVSLRINAPIGTTFYLNHKLHPIVVYKYQNSFIQDNTEGYYEIEPEDFINIQYVTFPKDTIPKLKYLDENQELQDVDPLKLCLTVSYNYDDDYDIYYDIINE